MTNVLRLTTIYILVMIRPISSTVRWNQTDGSESGNNEPKTVLRTFSILLPQNSVAVCLDDEDGPKFFNDTCQNDNNCFGGGVSMICHHGRCVCKESYVPEDVELYESHKEAICVKAPYVFQPCSTHCQKPLNCTDSTITTPNLKAPLFRSITGKSCQCLPPFNFQDGICFLDCNEDEYFVEDRCIKKCKVNEVRLKNYTCVSLAALGSKCEVDYQCQPLFSECRDGVCICHDGFHEENSSCISSVLNCPIGQPLVDGSNKTVKCTTNQLFSPLLIPVQRTLESAEQLSFVVPNHAQIIDTCPDSHYCAVVGIDAGPEAVGHCCSKPKLSCPIGLPHSKATCSVDPEGQVPVCPDDTHYCHSVVVGTYGEQVCCPRACSDGLVAVHGKCFPLVSLHDQCVVDEQCKNHNGLCESGRCNCSADTKPTGSKTFQFCKFECQPNEVLLDNRCYPRFNLGDNCNSTNSFMCPTNSACKKNKCSCVCGTYAINDNLCGPLPICSNGKDFRVKEEMLNEISVKELFSNATFCAIPGQKAQLDKVVNKCPDDEYCSNYMDHLGLCCQKIEPICPNGQKPDSVQNCDKKSPLSCGPNKFCHQFIHPVYRNSNEEAFICCPLERTFVFAPVELPPPQVPIK